MIVIFEQDTRPHGGCWFTWLPFLWRGWWADGPSWRIGWGLWSISVYRSPGLRDFFDHVEHTEWVQYDTRGKR